MTERRPRAAAAAALSLDTWAVLTAAAAIAAVLSGLLPRVPW